jgi:hypothetical protein
MLTSIPANSFPYPQEKKRYAAAAAVAVVVMIKSGRLGTEMTRCSNIPTKRHTIRPMHTHVKVLNHTAHLTISKPEAPLYVTNSTSITKLDHKIMCRQKDALELRNQNYPKTMRSMVDVLQHKLKKQMSE